MSLRDWIAETASRITSNGVAGIRESLYELYLGALRRTTPLTPAGSSVYNNHDWDVLVVLDACRVDVLQSVADEYDWLGEIGVHRSPASCSPEWLAATFHGESGPAVGETVYITGNPFSDRQLDHTRLQRVDELWRTAWDEGAGTIPPGPLTDRAIETMRRDDPDRLIVHYMQPHFPSPPDPVGEGISLRAFDETWQSPLDALRRGELNFDRVWESYESNLKYVLDSVALLLSSVDAETVVITADHGEAFGEYGVYAHPCGVPVPALRKVPWAEVSATDTGEYQLDETVSTAEPTTNTEERLKSLGYI